MPEKILYLHIGMPKTGYPTIQKTLFDLKKIKEIEFMKLGQSNHGGRIKRLFSSNSSDSVGHRMTNTSEQNFFDFDHETKKKLLEASNKNCSQIISGEGIFSMKEPALQKMRDFFSPFFDNIRVISYMHPPESYLVSAFQQYVKNQHLDSLNFTLLYPHYRRKIEKFDRVFGVENVSLTVLHPSRMHEGDVVKDFVYQISGEEIPDSLIQRENESLSLESIALIFTMNKFGHVFNPHESFARSCSEFNDIMSKFGEQKFHFSDQLLKLVFDEHKNDVAWIEKRLGMLFSELKVEGREHDIVINSERDLIEAAQRSASSFRVYSKKYFSSHDLKPQGIANLIELLRVYVAGKNSMGKKINSRHREVFTEELVQHQNGNYKTPARLLHQLALAYEHHGQLDVALHLIRLALIVRPDAIGLKKSETRLAEKVDVG
jgi:hypothetical protein